MCTHTALIQVPANHVMCVHTWRESLERQSNTVPYGECVYTHRACTSARQSRPCVYAQRLYKRKPTTAPCVYTHRACTSAPANHAMCVNFTALVQSRTNHAMCVYTTHANKQIPNTKFSMINPQSPCVVIACRSRRGMAAEECTAEGPGRGGAPSEWLRVSNAGGAGGWIFSS